MKEEKIEKKVTKKDTKEKVNNEGNIPKKKSTEISKKKTVVDTEKKKAEAKKIVPEKKAVSVNKSETTRKTSKVTSKVENNSKIVTTPKSTETKNYEGVDKKVIAKKVSKADGEKVVNQNVKAATTPKEKKVVQGEAKAKVRKNLPEASKDKLEAKKVIVQKKKEVKKESNEDALEETFANSIKQVKNNVRKNTAKATGEKDTTATKNKSNIKNVGNAKPKKQSVASRAAGVKKKISESVSKTTSEKSSKIQIKSKEKKNDITITKKDIEEITTDKELIEAENKAKREKILEDGEINFDVLDEELSRNNSMPAEDFSKLIKKSSLSNIYILGFVVFLIFDSIAYYNMPGNIFINCLRAFSFIFLIIAIVMLEISFNKEDSKKCITGIETLFMGIFTLSLPYMYQIYNGTFMNLVKSSAIIILGYCIVKMSFALYNNQSKYFRMQDDLVKEEADNEFNIDDEDDE